MNQTFIIFTLVAFLPVISSFFYFKVYGQLASIKISNIILCTPILIISLIYGARYDVGTDWYNYVDIFDSSRRMSYFDIYFKKYMLSNSSILNTKLISTIILSLLFVSTLPAMLYFKIRRLQYS